MESSDPVFGFPTIVRFSWAPAQRAMDERCVRVQWCVAAPRPGLGGAGLEWDVEGVGAKHASVPRSARESRWLAGALAAHPSLPPPA